MFKTKLILSVLAVLAVLTCTANTNVKKRIKMSYIKIYKQAKGIAKITSKQETEVRATHDACMGIRY